MIREGLCNNVGMSVALEESKVARKLDAVCMLLGRREPIKDSRFISRVLYCATILSLTIPEVFVTIVIVNKVNGTK
jgi:hypothetical protein